MPEKKKVLLFWPRSAHEVLLMLVFTVMVDVAVVDQMILPAAAHVLCYHSPSVAPVCDYIWIII